jgi:ABC-2 type transport system permease protein
MEALGDMAVQCGWVVVLGVAAWTMLRVGTRSLEVQGG